MSILAIPGGTLDLSGRLDGRVAMITGAARGMGEAHARELAGRGAALVLTDLDQEVSVVAQALTQEGARVVHVVCDLTSALTPQTLVDLALESFGRLDILVHNAGIMHNWKTLDETEVDGLDPYLALNVRAPFALTKAASQHLRASEAGRVVFISSQWGQVPDGHSYGYMVSKSAQLGLMKALAKEFIADRVLVNAVTPGAIATRMVPDEAYDMEVAAVPLGRLGEPEEIASLVGFLASDQAAFITGQTLAVNGGALIVGI